MKAVTKVRMTLLAVLIVFFTCWIPTLVYYDIKYYENTKKNIDDREHASNIIDYVLSTLFLILFVILIVVLL